MEANVRMPNGDSLRVRTNPDVTSVEVTISQNYGAAVGSAVISIPKERFEIWLKLAGATLRDCRDPRKSGGPHAYAEPM